MRIVEMQFSIVLKATENYNTSPIPRKIILHGGKKYSDDTVWYESAKKPPASHER